MATKCRTFRASSKLTWPRPKNVSRLGKAIVLARRVTHSCARCAMDGCVYQSLLGKCMVIIASAREHEVLSRFAKGMKRCSLTMLDGDHVLQSTEVTTNRAAAKNSAK